MIFRPVAAVAAVAYIPARAEQTAVLVVVWGRVGNNRRGQETSPLLTHRKAMPVASGAAAALMAQPQIKGRMISQNVPAWDEEVRA